MPTKRTYKKKSPRYNSIKHPSVKVNYKGTDIVIDEEIAPLIFKCWKLGIQTQYCCQGGGFPEVPKINTEELEYANRAYIMFMEKSDGFAFLHYLTKNSLSVLETNCEFFQTHYSYELNYDNNNISVEVDNELKHRKQTVVVRFHKNDIKMITNALNG